MKIILKTNIAKHLKGKKQGVTIVKKFMEILKKKRSSSSTQSMTTNQPLKCSPTRSHSRRRKYNSRIMFIKINSGILRFCMRTRWEKKNFPKPMNSKK